MPTRWHKDQKDVGLISNKVDPAFHSLEGDCKLSSRTLMGILLVTVQLCNSC